MKSIADYWGRSMAELFLGVDAGGTKTHAAIMSASGQLLALGTSATGNWERVGLDASAIALAQAVDSALGQCGRKRSEVTSASFALAGIDWDSDVATFERMLGGFGFGCAPVVMNDAMAVLMAGTDDGVGCASVAGTGGKTVARSGSTTLMTLGMALGEGGGAGQVVSEALTAIAAAYHGQRPPTLLTAAALEAYGVSSEEALFEAIAREGLQVSESFAPTVFAIAEAGDPAAVDVLKSVAYQHARDVVGLVNRLNFSGSSVPVICAGGVHTAGSTTFARAFEQGLVGSRWALETVVLDVVPVVGALVDSVVRTNGKITNAQRQQLNATAAEFDANDHNAIAVAS